MTRIIGGRLGGRRLRTPPGGSTRPTSDRVREAMFSTLDSMLGSLSGTRFLDLYAGSGAVGLEARSRGAALVSAVESDRRTARLVTENARSLGLEGVEVLAQPVLRALATPPAAPYHVAFADPPYPLEEVGSMLDLLVARHWVGDGSIVVVERSARSVDPDWPAPLTRPHSRRYGETVLWYAHVESSNAGADAEDGPGAPGTE